MRSEIQSGITTNDVAEGQNAMRRYSQQSRVKLRKSGRHSPYKDWCVNKEKDLNGSSTSKEGSKGPVGKALVSEVCGPSSDPERPCKKPCICACMCRHACMCTHVHTHTNKCISINVKRQKQ